MMIPEQIQSAAESWSADQTLRWAYGTYGNDVAVASAFGAEGVVLIDVAASIWPRLRVFILDTAFLFPETHRLIQQVEDHYQIEVERVLPSLTPGEQARIYGLQLWKRDPDLCCQIRKVEPLKEKLAQLRAWATAIRRDQTSARAHARKIEWDASLQVAKINPLADWSHDTVWNYIRAKQLPYNPLYDHGFRSIGCTHCTRAVRPGEEPRAGRWPGFAKRECGMHTQSRAPNQLDPSVDLFTHNE